MTDAERVSNPTCAEVREARQSIYGNPLTNHRGIAQIWASLLRPCWARIAAQRPIPPHVVALMFEALKLNRRRLVFHADNYIDAHNYAEFARAWQEACIDMDSPTELADAERLAEQVLGRGIPSGPERIYVAGPYSAGDSAGVNANVARAAEAGAMILRRGHHVHVPHTHTHALEAVLRGNQICWDRDAWLRLDNTYLTHWATSLLHLASSPGADWELARAEELGLKIYRSLDDILPVGSLA